MSDDVFEAVMRVLASVLVVCLVSAAVIGTIALAREVFPSKPQACVSRPAVLDATREAMEVEP